MKKIIVFGIIKVLFAGATIEPKSDATQDFSAEKTVTCTITAGDDVTKKTYTTKAMVTARN